MTKICNKNFLCPKYFVIIQNETSAYEH
uniref:Uncharacterized protein n=1 Tax=Anguilla anguilla TaxID=7936 RepID=A0A0E9XKM5_ANGAN